MPAWLGWVLVLNAATFALYGYDKVIAGSRRRRVPERVLLVMAAGGGSPGAYAAMHLFRHKTSNPGFRRTFFAIMASQATVLVVLAVGSLGLERLTT